MMSDSNGTSLIVFHTLVPELSKGRREYVVYERMPGGFPCSRSRFAVIHSRVSPGTRSGAPWVVATGRILDSVDVSTFVLVSGFGRLQFDYPLYEWLKRGGWGVAVAAGVSPDRSSRAERQHYRWFFQHPRLAWVVIGDGGDRRRFKRERGLFRDRLVASMSHILIPGLVRSGGNMDRLLSGFSDMGGIVRPIPLRPFSIIDHAREESIRVFQESVTGNRRIPEGYIWHYTRGRHEPWPDEGWENYLAYLGSTDRPVPYTPFDALKHILLRRRIFAGSALIRNGLPVVCFSQNDPLTMGRLFRWQRHLRRWRFTPYGVGIRISAAGMAGIRPVVYGSGNIFSLLPETDRFRFQRYEPPDVDWLEEREWRCRGDLDLSGVPERDILVCTAFRKEIPVLRRLWPGAVICLEDMISLQ